jgi:site-specific DNA recombinase
MEKTASMARKLSTTTTTAVGYARVSTSQQAEHGISLDAQVAKIRAYAALYDIELMDVVVDAGVSAKTLDRPGLQRALSMVRKGQVDAIIVAKLDRLTRSTRDLGTLVEEELSKGKWALLSVADQLDTRSASGRLVLNILGSVASWERDVISERTAEALSHKRSKGEKTGGLVPYSFAVDATSMLVEHTGEKALVDAIQAARTRGLSWRAIVAELTAKGFTSRTGKPLALTQVIRIAQA